MATHAAPCRAVGVSFIPLAFESLGVVSPPQSPPANFSRGVQCAFGELMRPFGFTASHLSPLMLTVFDYILFSFLISFIP